MIYKFMSLGYVEKSLLATFITFLVTLLGSSVVFLFKKISKNLSDAMLGFSSGVMIAASYFSLLAPAVDSSKELNINAPLIISIGFLLGGILLFVSDKILNKFISPEKKRIVLLVSSITIHNIPEGMAIGIAFGSLFYGISGATEISAIMLAISIAIQNFPEGAAVSIPLLREGISRKKAFILGCLSAIVEPIFGVIGAILVLKMKYLLPFFLSFAAGSMIYVVISELVPESQNNEKKDLMSLFTILGFTIMMILDIMFC